MDCMDIDLDFEEDKIKTFLIDKLQEVKCSNAELQAGLKAKQKFVNEEFNQKVDQAETDSDVRIIDTSWTKILYNKYALGIKVESTGSVEASLIWDSESSLDYRTFTFDEPTSQVQCSDETCNLVNHSLVCSSKFSKIGHLIIVVNQPLFLDKLELNISGFITATWDNVFDNPVMVNIPSFKISALDHASHQLLDRNIIGGSKEELMAYIACSLSSEFTMVLPDSWDTELDSTFEIHCSLAKIDIKLTCKKMYYAYKLSESFDGNAVTVHPSKETSHLFYVTVYYKNTDSMVSFIHHMYSNIPGVAFIPKKYHENYVNISSNTNYVGNLNEALKNEVKWVHKSLKEVPSINRNKSGLRENLSTLEHQTDKLYLKVCKKVNDEGEDIPYSVQEELFESN